MIIKNVMGRYGSKKTVEMLKEIEGGCCVVSRELCSENFLNILSRENGLTIDEIKELSPVFISGRYSLDIFKNHTFNTLLVDDCDFDMYTIEEDLEKLKEYRIEKIVFTTQLDSRRW